MDTLTKKYACDACGDTAGWPPYTYIGQTAFLHASGMGRSCAAPDCFGVYHEAATATPASPDTVKCDWTMCGRGNCVQCTPYPTEPRLGSTQNVLRSLPDNAGERKAVPITTGVLDYFPLAVAEVARLSLAGNEQHNPGQPLHWARGKSSDHADCLVRHLIQRGTPDKDGITHTAKVAWRALALLQEELEARAGFTP